MAEPLLASRHVFQTSTFYMHAHTQEPLLQSTDSHVPSFNSFLCVLIVQLRWKIPCGGA